MKIILLSGGSGKRLWPLSNDSRSKQFLKVLRDEHGVQESMVQRVWRQLEASGLSDDVFVSTSKEQVDMLQNQLGCNVPLIIEPSRRDTFPAISLATITLFQKYKIAENEVLIFLPVDPYVEIEYFEKMKELEEALLASSADIALLGVVPTYPSEKYGYIIPKQPDENQQFLLVDFFKEKPEAAEAQNLINKNALWNCGVFAFKASKLLGFLADKGYPLDYEEFLAQYNSMQRISFDYMVVEKSEKNCVLVYNGYWKDLGTWNTLTEEMPTYEIGNGQCIQSPSTHLVNELDVPVVVLGIPNAIVAVSSDGILVSDKTLSYKIKEVVSISHRMPMYEERKWGTYRTIDHILGNGQETVVRKVFIKKNENLSYHKHTSRMEVITIVDGEGFLILNEELVSIKSGDSYKIAPCEFHSIFAVTDINIIEVQYGNQLNEGDTERLFYKWGDICRYLSFENTIQSIGEQ